MSSELLTLLTVNELKQRIPLLDTTERPSRKADLVKLILKHMLSSRIEVYWQHLEPLEQHAIAEAMYSWNGQFIAQQFYKKYSAVPEIFIRDRHNQTTNSQKNASVLPLFFYEGTIPDEFIAKLTTFVSRPADDAIKTCPQDEIPEHFSPQNQSAKKIRQLTMEAVVSHDLPAILRLVDSGKINVSDKTYQATGASIKVINAILAGSDFYSPEEDIEQDKAYGGSIQPIRPFAWPLLLQSGGLAKRNGKKLELTRKGKKALDAHLGDTIKELYNRWRDKGILDEYSRVDLVKGQNGKGRRMTAVAERRSAIEDALMCCPEGEWVAVDELFRYMQADGSELQVAHNPWKLYICDSNYGSLGYLGADGFEVLEGRYLLVYLFEYVATLGMIDVAYVPPYDIRDDFCELWGADDLRFLSRYDGLLYFRLNPLGAWCLDLTTSYQPTELPVIPLLRVDEQLHIDLIREATPGEILLLDRYTISSSNRRRALTPESLLDALEQGLAPEPLLEFLQKYSDEPLNCEVNQFFSEFLNRSTALSDGGTARLINCGNAGLARMISTDPATRAHCQLGKESSLVVPAKSEVALRKGLRKLGYVDNRFNNANETNTIYASPQTFSCNLPKILGTNAEDSPSSFGRLPAD